jgi:hypothetical protein
VKRAARVIVAVLVVLAIPSQAAAYRGDGVFRLMTGDTSLWVEDATMLPDGSVLAGGALITPDRHVTLLDGFGGGGLAASPDGSVLGLAGNEILRWTPGLGVTRVAGTGEEGFSGDGGPAIAARMSVESVDVTAHGIVALPDGGFLFGDLGNDRIRAVDAAGTIRTFARIRAPIGLAAAADGTYLATGLVSGRVYRVTPGGAVPISARVDAVVGDVAVAGDGSAVVVAEGLSAPALWRLAPGAHRARPYLRWTDPGHPFDFANRSFPAVGVGADGRGGLVLVDGRGEIDYVPSGPTPWTLAALRDTRPSRHAVTAVIETTQPGTATLDVLRGHRVVARVEQAVGAGHSTLTATGSIRPTWHLARLSFRGPDGVVVTDRVPIHGARRLTVALTRRILGRGQGRTDEEGSHLHLGPRCRQFGPRRVDCEIRLRTSCWDVASVTLHRTGVVLRREYPCASAGGVGFRRRPRYLASYGIRTLNRLDGGAWNRWY